MQSKHDPVCVILAGGRGKRMGAAGRHKVCFPVLDRPAIVRAIDTYKEAGLRRFLVVVGQMAHQVIETVAAAHPEVTFVYQKQPRGTGHAALMAVEALAAQASNAPVMIVMGDKVTEARVVFELLHTFAESAADAVLSVLPKTPESTAGRIVEAGDGSVQGVVEVADLERAATAGSRLRVGEHEFSPVRIEEQSRDVNASMYLFHFAPLQDALRHLSPNNVQGELYLTDTIAYLARRGRIRTLRISDGTALMAFNTPAELLAVEEVVRARQGAPLVTVDPLARLGPQYLKPVREWLAALESFPESLHLGFRAVYGDDPAVIDERRRACLELGRGFAAQYELDEPTVLCRAPGRVNLMGRHVDHRGGFVNVMAINREVLVMAAPRSDDVVRLRNMNGRLFPNREFRISQLLQESSWDDWMGFLASATVRRVLQSAPGDWSHYVRAPLLRLQYEHRQQRLKGMDCMVSGNIPMGAGLSSSSALVVAFAEAAVVLNGLDVAMRDFIDLCGEGEWFVGSRGGSADHAAIRTGQLGHISRIGFFPFAITDEVPLPTELRVVLAHSGAQAIKSREARDVFNQRVACCELAQLLLRERWPAAAGMKHLRDLTPTRLGVQPADVYRALTLLPQRPSRRRLRELLPRRLQTQLDRIFATHANIGTYDLRGVALFAISECVRSEGFAAIVQERKLDRVGPLMRASHDGDRRFRHDRHGARQRHLVRLDNAGLQHLAAGGADLETCSGRYACSTAAIDQLVDAAAEVEGVVGAQLAGAGLGGCLMILVQAQAVETLSRHLGARFYEPHQLPQELHICSPVAGAGLLATAE